MRFLYFVPIFVFSFAAHAGRPISGLVERNASGYNLISDKDKECPSYFIETKSEDAAQAVNKLSHGDYITATGLFDSGSCNVLIESIEYVGLKKLLGYWYTSDGIITVRDFNSLSFYPINRRTFDRGVIYRTANPVEYRYSVTPSEGREWVLFLSDKKSTTFATLEFNRGSATLKMYDSDTGKVTKTLYLSKWGNLR